MWCSKTHKIDIAQNNTNMLELHKKTELIPNQRLEKNPS